MCGKGVQAGAGAPLHGARIRHGGGECGKREGGVVGRVVGKAERKAVKMPTDGRGGAVKKRGWSGKEAREVPRTERAERTAMPRAGHSTTVRPLQYHCTRSTVSLYDLYSATLHSVYIYARARGLYGVRRRKKKEEKKKGRRKKGRRKKKRRQEERKKERALRCIGRHNGRGRAGADG